MMKRFITTVGLCSLVLIGQNLFAQTDKEKAYEMGISAIKFMDGGKIDESMKLLEKAQKLDPENINYPYELAYAHYLKEDYKGAIKILEKNTNHKDVNDRVFQLLGNSYDVLGKTDKAFEAYDAGLKLFPNSGLIYLEKGNVYWSKKEYNNALPFYEKGIEVDPQFSSNYYRAALLYTSSTEEVWGMIYGEIFMNLERNSKRTAEISKLLFDTYKREIKFTSETSYSVSFSQNNTINSNDIKDGKQIKLPFGVGAYEPTLLLSIVGDKKIDLGSLDRIRSRFVDSYFERGNGSKYPNLLFDYQKKVKDAGHLEAYNYWVLMKGDEPAFNSWCKQNKAKWDAFLKWFSDNGLSVDGSNRFFRGQY